MVYTLSYMEGNIEKKIWFKAKQYGWGWYPASWEGWAVLGLYVAWVLKRAFTFSPEYVGFEGILDFLVDIVIPTIFLLIICYARGETPRWRWGK